MPSASAKLEKQASMEVLEPIKQIVTMVEKRVRNLEKRKAKLDSYKSDFQNGKELNEDQKKAVEKYDQVVEILDFAKEMQKSFNGVIQESMKVQKKMAKREHIERQQFELQRIKEIIVIQDILNSMGGDDVRSDFLKGANGAVTLTESELNNLDELYKIICPERDPDSPDASEFEKQLASSADHVQSLLDSKNKEVIGTTYKALRETISKICSCHYFSKSKATGDHENNQDSSADVEESAQPNEVQAFSLPNATVTAMGDDIQPAQTRLRTSSGDLSYYQQQQQLQQQGDTNRNFQDQSQPIQEVLPPVQGNLNFIQESQIDLESPRAEPQQQQPMIIASSNVGYPASYVSSIQTSPHYHHQQKSKEEVILAPRISNTQILPNPVSLAAAQQQQQQNAMTFSVASMQMPVNSAPVDYDPTRPIPSQTYTNQSFNSSSMHPMMAQTYVPVTLTHALPPQHILPGGLVTQTIHLQQQRSSNAATQVHTTAVSGHSQPPGLSVPASMSKLSLNVKDVAKEQFIARDFQMAKVSRESPHLGQTTGPPSSQYEHVNHEAYQSTNSNQVYLSRDNFSVDNSTYSGNLKRGLQSRNLARGSGNRGATATARTNRGSYRN